MRDIIFGHYETAACFLVETVNDTGPLLSADSGQRRAVAEQSVDQSMFTLTRARVNGEAGGFVDNDDVIVFEEDVECNRLRPHMDLLDRGLAEINFVAASNDLPRSSDLFVEPNEPAADQLLQARPGIFRKPLCQKLVKTQLGVVLSYNKFDRRPIFQCLGSRSEQEHEQA